jgi:hypothetical protein
MRPVMTFPALNLLLPAVLAVHNIDEYSRYDQFVRLYQRRIPERFTTRRVMRDAMILLTLTAAVISALTYLFRTPALLSVSKIAVFALMLNAIGHCVQSLTKRRMMPGILSAITLVLPYSIAAIMLMRSQLGDSVSSLLGFTLAGAITIPLAGGIFVLWGYGVSQLGNKA